MRSHSGLGEGMTINSVDDIVDNTPAPRRLLSKK